MKSGGHPAGCPPISGPVSRVLSPRSGGDHLSGTPITRRLMRPYPGNRRAASSSPVWSCSGRGLPSQPVTRLLVGSYPTFAPLPDTSCIPARFRSPSRSAIVSCLIPGPRAVPGRRALWVAWRIEAASFPCRWSSTGSPVAWRLQVCRAVYFCGTILGVSPTGRYPASCPGELGLSSGTKVPAITRPTDSGILSPRHAPVKERFPAIPRAVTVFGVASTPRREPESLSQALTPARPALHPLQETRSGDHLKFALAPQAMGHLEEGQQSQLRFLSLLHRDLLACCERTGGLATGRGAEGAGSPQDHSIWPSSGAPL